MPRRSPGSCSRPRPRSARSRRNRAPRPAAPACPPDDGFEPGDLERRPMSELVKSFASARELTRIALAWGLPVLVAVTLFLMVDYPSIARIGLVRDVAAAIRGT